MSSSISRSYLISVPDKDFSIHRLLSSTNAFTETLQTPRHYMYQNSSTQRTTTACCSYPIPELLVGTINTLMNLSDDLIKLDSACKSVVMAIERQGKDLYQKQYKDVTGDKLNNWSHVDSNRSMLEYFMGFQWAEQKYPKGYPLQELSNLIKGKVSKMEDDLKHFQQNYLEKRNLKSAADRMGKGNLLVKDLSNVLQVESEQERAAGTTIVSTGQPLRSTDFLDTQFMKTLVVAVPTSAVKEFEKNYTTLGDPEQDKELEKSLKESDSLLSGETKSNSGGGGGGGGQSSLDVGLGGLDGSSLPCSPVVPGSLMKIVVEEDASLYLMTVLKSQQERVHGDIDGWTIADSFYHACRKNRVVVREFDRDPRKASANRAAKSKLDSDYLHYEGKTLDWCKVHYGEAVTAWGHVKAIRIHVESVLRYGLPPKFNTILLVPKAGKEKKLRNALQQLYGTLEENEFEADSESGGGGPGMMDMGDYYPYVSVNF